MSLGTADIRDYRASESKNKWRRMVWKDIARNCPVSPCDAKVIGLMGANGEDAFMAVANGFKLKNIVSVDTNPSVVKACRRHGVVALQSDLSAALAFWPESNYFSVVYADLCTNFDGLMSSPLFGTLLGVASVRSPRYVLCLNLLRGRENKGWLTALRDGANEDRRELPKHRGQLAWYALSLRARNKTGKKKDTAWMPSISKRYRSYRSGVSTMDSLTVAMNRHSGPTFYLRSPYFNRILAAARATRTFKSK